MGLAGIVIAFGPKEIAAWSYGGGGHYRFYRVSREYMLSVVKDVFRSLLMDARDWNESWVRGSA